MPELRLAELARGGALQGIPVDAVGELVSEYGELGDAFDDAVTGAVGECCGTVSEVVRGDEVAIDLLATAARAFRSRIRQASTEPSLFL